MFGLYYVKETTFGVAEGVVERIHATRAMPLLEAGIVEPYDERSAAHIAAAERAGYVARVRARPVAAKK